MLRIKQVLEDRGITQGELARRCGLKRQAVSRIVNGAEPAYAKRGERIAAALDWPGDPAELFEQIEVI